MILYRMMFKSICNKQSIADLAATIMKSIRSIEKTLEVKKFWKKNENKLTIVIFKATIF